MTQKIALITGGSRGLGRSSALHLANANVGVVITYQSKEQEAKDVVDEINSNGGLACALKLDVSDSSSFSAFRDNLLAELETTFQRTTFDYLVNNAGYGLFNSFEDTTEAELDSMYSVHLKGPFFLTQCLAALIENQGRILNVSSGLTRVTAAGYDAYAIAKGGMEVMTRYQAATFASRGITVNTIAPGAVETDFGGGFVRDTPELNKHIASITALGRVGLPDDIGSAITGLLVAGSVWMTGQRIEVSGGYTL